MHQKTKCTKCGSETHISKECKFTGVCAWCKKVGHTDSVCHAKKANKPRAFHADGNGNDGGEIYGNMIRVAPIPAKALYQGDPAPTRRAKNANSTKRAQQPCKITLPAEIPTLTVGNTTPVCYMADKTALPDPPIGTVRERFMADTGANMSIHPNGRAAASFY